jgi:THO complex subunit 2
VQAVEHITQNLLSSVMVLHPAKVWDDISPQLYVTFWTLSLYDLHVPVDCYETEISKLQQIADEADANAELVENHNSSYVCQSVYVICTVGCMS